MKGAQFRPGDYLRDRVDVVQIPPICNSSSISSFISVLSDSLSLVFSTIGAKFDWAPSHNSRQNLVLSLDRHFSVDRVDHPKESAKCGVYTRESVIALLRRPHILNELAEIAKVEAIRKLPNFGYCPALALGFTARRAWGCDSSSSSSWVHWVLERVLYTTFVHNLKDSNRQGATNLFQHTHGCVYYCSFPPESESNLSLFQSLPLNYYSICIEQGPLYNSTHAVTSSLAPSNIMAHHFHHRNIRSTG